MKRITLRKESPIEAHLLPDGQYAIYVAGGGVTMIPVKRDEAYVTAGDPISLGYVSNGRDADEVIAEVYDRLTSMTALELIRLMDPETVGFLLVNEPE